MFCVWNDVFMLLFYVDLGSQEGCIVILYLFDLCFEKTDRDNKFFTWMLYHLELNFLLVWFYNVVQNHWYNVLRIYFWRQNDINRDFCQFRILWNTSQLFVLISNAFLLRWIIVVSFKKCKCFKCIDWTVSLFSFTSFQYEMF